MSALGFSQRTATSRGFLALKNFRIVTSSEPLNSFKSCHAEAGPCQTNHNAGNDIRGIVNAEVEPADANQQNAYPGHEHYQRPPPAASMQGGRQIRDRAIDERRAHGMT